MITIAGSGPSAALVDHVDIATKRQSVNSDYVFLRFLHSLLLIDCDKPLLLYYRRRDFECKNEKHYIDSDYWDKYYKRFTRSKRPPQKQKPSSGLCAVFAAVERWKPQTIGLIGFDWVLDGNADWEHDAQAEKQAILSLVNIKDLRDDSIIRRL